MEVAILNLQVYGVCRLCKYFYSYEIFQYPLRQILKIIYKHWYIFLDKVIISCEKYIDGNIILLKNIEKNKIKNILLHNGNVYDVLESIHREYFDLVWIFFPDPWPKNRHAKRRLITTQFLLKLHQILKKHSEIYIATDSKIYVRFILNSIYNCKDYFLWINQSQMNLHIKDYFDIETKYYKKAINSQRKPSLFILRKL